MASKEAEHMRFDCVLVLSCREVWVHSSGDVESLLLNVGKQERTGEGWERDLKSVEGVISGTNRRPGEALLGICKDDPK